MSVADGLKLALSETPKTTEEPLLSTGSILLFGRKQKYFMRTPFEPSFCEFISCTSDSYMIRMCLYHTHTCQLSVWTRKQVGTILELTENGGTYFS